MIVSNKQPYKLAKDEGELDLEALDFTNMDDVSKVIARFEYLLNSPEPKDGSEIPKYKDRGVVVKDCSTSASGSLSKSDENLEEFIKENMALVDEGDMKLSSSDEELPPEEEEKQAASRSEQIVKQIKQMCDVFAPYSYDTRELFLDEIELIMKSLSPEEIGAHVMNALSIFVDEKDDLKNKFLQKVPVICRHLCEVDKDRAMNQIIIHVLPYLSVVLMKNCELVRIFENF